MENRNKKESGALPFYCSWANRLLDSTRSSSSFFK